jgi:hypothetical protein
MPSKVREVWDRACLRFWAWLVSEAPRNRCRCCKHSSLHDPVMSWYACSMQASSVDDTTVAILVRGEYHCEAFEPRAPFPNGLDDDVEGFNDSKPMCVDCAHWKQDGLCDLDGKPRIAFDEVCEEFEYDAE